MKERICTIIYLTMVALAITFTAFALYADGPTERILDELYGDRFWRLGSLWLAVAIGITANIAFVHSSFEKE